jgi:hypothetical protein
MTEAKTNTNANPAAPTPQTTPASTEGGAPNVAAAHAEEVMQNKVYVSRPLGLKNLNYPTIDEDGKITTLARPIYLTTTLSHARMMGRAFRDMVIPSMLPLFLDGIQKRSLDSPRQLQMILGGPGLGKSYMARAISMLRSDDPLITTEVGNKSVGELLFETVIDPASSVGIGTKYGKLIEAWTEGRELLVDEYNKAKPGSDATLQLTWQLMTGEMNEVTVLGGAGKKFTFKRSEMKPGFFVTLTGNFAEDGISTYELATSAYSRLQPKFTPPATKADWQHRICQVLTGLPVSTLYAMNQTYWDTHESDFKRALEELRELGLTDNEKKLIPSHQHSYIANWKDVLEASNRLAEFYTEWYAILHAKGRIVGTKKPDVPAEIIGELNESYVRRVDIDMRRMIALLNDSLEVFPPTRSTAAIKDFTLPADFAAEPAPGLIIHEPVERFFGNRVTTGLAQDIRQTTEPFGKGHIEEALFGLAIDKKIFPPADGSKPKGKLLAELLDSDTIGGIKIGPEIVKAQAQFCKFLRKRYPGLPDQDDNIMPATTIVRAMASIEEAARKVDEGYAGIGFFDPAAVVNGDPRALPLLPAVYADLYHINHMPADKVAIEGARIKKAKLLTTEEFLLSLALPERGLKNIEALWKYSIGEVTKQSSDTVVQIADNKSTTGLAITAVTCRDGTAPVSLVVIHNSKTNQTTVFGNEHIANETREFLSGGNVNYVNTDQGQADVDRAIDDIIGSTDKPLLRKLLANALLLRSKGNVEQSLPQMIMRPAFQQPVFAMCNIY